MSRQKKQTVDYFPHYVNHAKTIFILENTWGNDGYAFWFKILELLGLTDGHYYDCNNTADWEFLLARTKIDDNTANSILNKLAVLDAIDKDLWHERIIWSDNFVKGLMPVYSNRKSDIPQKPVSTNSKACAEGNLSVENHFKCETTPRNPQSKVKESKVDKSRGEDSNTANVKQHYADNVSMSPEEYQKLIEKYDEDFINEKIIDLDLWKGSKGKRTKSDYMTLLSWIRRDVKENKQPKGNKAYNSNVLKAMELAKKYEREETEELEGKSIWDV